MFEQGQTSQAEVLNKRIEALEQQLKDDKNQSQSLSAIDINQRIYKASINRQLGGS